MMLFSNFLLSNRSIKSPEIYSHISSEKRLISPIATTFPEPTEAAATSGTTIVTCLENSVNEEPLPATTPDKDSMAATFRGTYEVG